MTDNEIIWHLEKNSYDEISYRTFWKFDAIPMALKNCDEVWFKYLWEHRAPWIFDKNFCIKYNIDLETSDCRDILFRMINSTGNKLSPKLQIFLGLNLTCDKIAKRFWCKNEQEFCAALRERIESPSTSYKNCVECFRISGINSVQESLTN